MATQTKRNATKSEKRAAKKAELARQSAAVAAANWQDRPDSGKARPTPERRAKGSFVLRDTEDAGVTVAIDEAPTMLDRLHAKHIITASQRDGGLDLAALLRRTMLVSEGRSCLDWTPVATGDDSEPTHAELRDAEERAEIYLACGMVVFAELRRVCHEHQMPRSIDRLRQGLDICARFWGGRG